MVDFAHSTEAAINASPQAIFDIVSNPARHLAGIPQIKPTFLEIAPSGIP